jgi:hypothetical protein
MIPIFLSAPRTRSSILFESSRYYVEQELGLKSMINHPEFFLESSRNAEFIDTKTGESHTGELYPIIDKNDNIKIHFIYPHVFDNHVDRLYYKLDLLKTQKAKGINYNLKATLDVVDIEDDFIDFFKDRHFIITKRRDLIDYCLSFLVAWSTRIFHARANNFDRYTKILADGVWIPIHGMQVVLQDFLEATKKIWMVETKLARLNIPHTVVYYEDLNSWDNIQSCITGLFNTRDWINCLPSCWNDISPIQVDKNYSSIITNYDETMMFIDRALSTININSKE